MRRSCLSVAVVLVLAGCVQPPPLGSVAEDGACRVQEGTALSVAPLRAVGTEPFWGARIEGRCVTYSHIDDQQGTRVLAQFQQVGGDMIWSGTLRGQPFELRARPMAECSDGMSDKLYPLAVTLQVDGEQRTGCAEPL